MEPQIPKHLEDTIQIQGKNFHAFIALTEDTLSLDITEFKKRNVYASIITNLQLEKQTRRFLIFKKVEELFEELRQNKRLQISDQNLLLIPVEIQYKNKTIELTIELPLAERKFNNEAEITQDLFEKIEKINSARAQLQKKLISAIQHIDFKGDPTNQNYHSFKISRNVFSQTIEMVENSKDTIFNHFQPLPKQGIFSFKVKIVKSTKKFIFVGICRDNIKSLTGSNAYDSPYFVGLYLANGNLYMNGNNINAIKDLSVCEGQIVEVKINMSKKSISWFFWKESKHFETLIAMELRNTSIHPMVDLYSKGDILEMM